MIKKYKYIGMIKRLNMILYKNICNYIFNQNQIAMFFTKMIDGKSE